MKILSWSDDIEISIVTGPKYGKTHWIVAAQSKDNLATSAGQCWKISSSPTSRILASDVVPARSTFLVTAQLQDLLFGNTLRTGISLGDQNRCLMD